MKAPKTVAVVTGWQLLMIWLLSGCVLNVAPSTPVQGICVEPSGSALLSSAALSDGEIGVGPVETILPTEKKPYSWPDGTMGVIRIGTDYRFFGAADGSPKRTAGTLDDPTFLEVRDLKIENLGKPYHYAGGGPVYEDRGSGTLLMFYHAEFYTFPPEYLPFYSELGLAKSTDGGSTWTDLGPIITPQTPMSSDFFQVQRKAFDMGWGAYAIVGDYFYVYFGDLVKEGERYTQVNLAVARARVRDVVEAAIDKNMATPWTKYFKGAWMESAIGGRSSSLLDQGNAWLLLGDVSYNQCLRKFIAVLVGPPWPETDLYWLESDDGLRWENFQKVIADPGHDYYVTIIGLGDNPQRTDRQFYIYYIQSQEFGRTGHRNRDAVLVRRLITVSGNMNRSN